MPEESVLRKVAEECASALRKQNEKSPLASAIDKSLNAAFPDWEKLLQALRSAHPDDRAVAQPLANAITSGGKGGFYKPGDKFNV